MAEIQATLKNIGVEATLEQIENKLRTLAQFKVTGTEAKRNATRSLAKAAGVDPAALFKGSSTPVRIADLVSIRKQVNKPFKQAKEDDMKQYGAWLEKSDFTDWTKCDLKIILRIYLRWLGKEELISWLKVKQLKNGVLPEEILTEDDIKAIARAAYTTKDKAFVLSLYDSGLSNR